MKLKMKTDGNKLFVLKNDDTVLSTWTLENLTQFGGMNVLLEKYKTKIPSLQVELINIEEKKA